MNLLHLVSGQTGQNLLPILALQPSAVIQVRSAVPVFEKAASHLETAVRVLARSGAIQRLPEFFNIKISSASPTPDETRSKVGEALALWPGCVVNITGGTKLMAIGALLAADYQNEPVLYCDTQQAAFLSIGKKVPLPALPPLHEIAQKLTVEALLAAHGIAPETLLFENPRGSAVAFAREVFAIRKADPAAFDSLLEKIRGLLYPGNGNRLLPKSQIDRLLADGLPDPGSATGTAFYRAAGEAGFLRLHNGRFFFQLPGDPANKENRLRATDALCKTLTGGWFELLVYDRLRATNRFADLRVGVQSRDNSQALGETDIIGVDASRASLAFVSCKLSDHAIGKPLEHVFSLRHRASEFGGTFATAIFQAGFFHNSNRMRQIETACKVAGVELPPPVF